MQKKTDEVEQSEFRDWYVLKVRSKRENYIKETLEKFLGNEIKLLIFTKEVLHKKNDQYLPITAPIFPGYLFVHKELNKVIHTIQTILNNEVVYPVSFDNTPAKVSVDEMKLLLSSTENGKFHLSQGYKSGDSVVITDGPLKEIKGKIVFINEKKRKAKLCICLFGKEMQVSLGLDLLNSDLIH
jgi:transcription termination/antitermination protein NusG